MLMLGRLNWLEVITAKRQVNMHEAKTHLSRLVDEAAAGEPFVIWKAGRPMVRVTHLGRISTRSSKTLSSMS